MQEADRAAGEPDGQLEHAVVDLLLRQLRGAEEEVEEQGATLGLPVETTLRPLELGDVAEGHDHLGDFAVPAEDRIGVDQDPHVARPVLPGTVDPGDEVLQRLAGHANPVRGEFLGRDDAAVGAEELPGPIRDRLAQELVLRQAEQLLRLAVGCHDPGVGAMHDDGRPESSG